jgi:hypothetical protein
LSRHSSRLLEFLIKPVSQKLCGPKAHEDFYLNLSMHTIRECRRDVPEDVVFIWFDLCLIWNWPALSEECHIDTGVWGNTSPRTIGVNDSAGITPRETGLQHYAGIGGMGF